MDVVKTNLDRLGGKVEIDSVPGKGSAFRIKLPLTLAIIPSLLVSDSGQRFAIAQVSVGELMRIPADQIEDRTDRAGDAELVLLRDRLVPLVYLSDALGSPRAERGSKALNIVLVDTGTLEYGLVVGELHDTVEIVVKPMGRHLQGLVEYAGATILGDGQVAVILDVAGLAARAGLSRASAKTLDSAQAAGGGCRRRSPLAAVVPKRAGRRLRGADRTGDARGARARRASGEPGWAPDHAVWRGESAFSHAARCCRGG